jgi:tRNA-2-methylthio-N6-dimethylallyladenosine synthase
MSGDFIVGFPGETEEDFRATLRLVEEVGYASAFTFKYSARPGTPAAADEDQIAEDVKIERLARLQAAIDRQTREFNASRLGMVMDVLFEKPGRKAGQLGGRSPWLQAVHVKAPAELLGRIVPVRIDAVGANSLSGVLVEETARPIPAQGGVR